MSWVRSTVTEQHFKKWDTFISKSGHQIDCLDVDKIEEKTEHPFTIFTEYWFPFFLNVYTKCSTVVFHNALNVTGSDLKFETRLDGQVSKSSVLNLLEVSLTHNLRARREGKQDILGNLGSHLELTKVCFFAGTHPPFFCQFSRAQVWKPVSGLSWKGQNKQGACCYKTGSIVLLKKDCTFICMDFFSSGVHPWLHYGVCLFTAALRRRTNLFWLASWQLYFVHG